MFGQRNLRLWIHIYGNNPGTEKPELYTYFWCGRASESNNLQDVGGHGNGTEISVLGR